jgi:hypothetical protein
MAGQQCRSSRSLRSALTKCQQEAIAHAEDKGVPSLVLHVDQRVHSVANQEREQDPAKILECKLEQESEGK